MASVLSFEPKKFVPGIDGDISRKVNHNIGYIANLLALRQWYRFVRREFFIRFKYGEALYAGALDVLDEAIIERIRQLRLFAQNLEKTIIAAEKMKKNLSGIVLRKQKQFIRDWPHMEEYLSGNSEEKISLKKKETFIKIIQRQSGKANSYLQTIQALTSVQTRAGMDWLNDVVQEVAAGCMKISGVLRQK